MEMLLVVGITLVLMLLNSRVKVADNSSQLMYLYTRHNLDMRYPPTGINISDKL